MQHITQTNRWGHWEQEIKKWEASKLDLDKLPRCGSCGTTKRTEGLCSYCKQQDAEDKLKMLVFLSREILKDFEYEEEGKKRMSDTKIFTQVKKKGPIHPKGYKCSVCGQVPDYKTYSYLTFRPQGDICKTCRLDAKRKLLACG
jgi:ribosomal protein L32